MTLYAVVILKIKKESKMDLKVNTAIAIGSVLGGVIGKMLYKRINNTALNNLFVGAMLIIILINSYNALQFSQLTI